MNLFNRLVHQVQKPTTQLKPRSSMSLYENPPLLEHTTFRDDRDTLPASSDNKERFNMVKPLASKPHSVVKDNSYHYGSDVESPVAKKNAKLLPNEESRVNQHITLVSPPQKKSTQNVQGILHTQIRPDIESVLQNDSEINSSQNDKLTPNDAGEDAITKFNLEKLNVFENNRQSTEAGSVFQPILQNNKFSNPVFGTAPVAEKSTQQTNDSTPVEVHISIGKIEVKAHREPFQAIKKVKRKAPMSLATYLAEREDGKR